VCGDAPPVFDAAEEVLNFVPLPVKTPGTIGFFRSGAAIGDDR